MVLSKPLGQKMPNMSTVASLVTYRSSEIIDIMINMFINVGAQKPANGRFINLKAYRGRKEVI